MITVGLPGGALKCSKSAGRMKACWTLAALLGPLNLYSADSVTPVTMEIRRVVERTSSQSREMTLIHPEHGQREVLEVENKVLLDEGDVTSGAVVQDPRTKEFLLELRFTEQGRKKFGEITGQNIGRRIAIIINGKLTSAPKVNESISSGRIIISGAVGREQLEKWAEAFKATIKRPGAL
jgi:preprotein translocase subunit SecD